MNKYLALFLLASVLCFTANQAQEAVIGPDSVFVTTSCDQQVPAFRLALRDVHQDWYGTFGRIPIRQTSIPSPSSLKHYSSSAVVIVGSRQCLSQTFPEYSSLLPPLKTEQHVCQLLAYNQTGLFNPVVCYGEDVLGTVYSLYAFSHEILGIHPQAFWIELKPTKVPNITVPAKYMYDSGVPTWKNRGFFINDEDQLGGWAMDPLGQKVFNLQAWDMVYQTTLRLRGNTVIVGTSAYPDEQSFDLAIRRGLSLSQHHVTILGTAMFAWPDGLPYDFPFNPEVVSENWKRNVQFQLSRNRKVIWTVGYRGKNDYPFWNDVPSFNTSESRGKLISEAITAQLKIIADNGGADQEKVGYLWSELLDLYAGGYLKFPSDVHVVHADNGAGQIFHQELIDQGHGVYYHNAMMSDHHNQLTELLSPSRLFEQLKKFVEKLALAYFLLNTSDLRAVPLSTKVCMDFAWNSQQFLNVSPIDAQTAVINAWVAKSYLIPSNSKLAGNITDLYNAYFAVPYMAATTGLSTTPLGEHHLATIGRNFADNIISWGTSNKKSPLPVSNAKQEIALLASSVPILNSILQSATNLMSQVPQQRQSFFNSNVLVQLKIHYHGASALTEISQAVIALQANSVPSAIQNLQTALGHLDQLFAAEQTAEDGQWQNWYMWDQIVDWVNLRDAINTAIITVQGETEKANLPPMRPHLDGTGPWSQEFQYEYDAQTYFPLFYDSEYYMDTAITVMCANTATTCRLTPIGVDFSGANTQVVLGAQNTQVVIRYTLDGTNPTNSSTAWSGKPIVLTNQWAGKNVTLNAAAFQSNGNVAGPITKAVVVAKSS